jgi:hypothetical protein
MTDTERLDWLIRMSDPTEIFSQRLPEWDTEEDLLGNWRQAIDKEIQRGKT